MLNYLWSNNIIIWLVFKGTTYESGEIWVLYNWSTVHFDHFSRLTKFINTTYTIKVESNHWTFIWIIPNQTDRSVKSTWFSWSIIIFMLQWNIMSNWRIHLSWLNHIDIMFIPTLNNWYIYMKGSYTTDISYISTW